MANANDAIVISDKHVELSTNNPSVLEVTEQLMESLSPEELAAVAVKLLGKGRIEMAAALVELTRIYNTKTMLGNTEPEYKPQLDILVQTAQEYSLEKYIEKRGVSKLNKKLIADYFDYLRNMLKVAGFQLPTGIKNDAGGGNMNLWPGTRDLAEKITRNSARYNYFPAANINHPELVLKTLKEIEDPGAFIELLLGDTEENIYSLPGFLKAFATAKSNPENDIKAKMAFMDTLTLAVQGGWDD